MVIHDPPHLPDGVCDTCAGSGFDPDEFYATDPQLGRLITPCPDCEGSGEQPTPKED
jgi:DnaJ-class molecular chaperone